MKEILIRFYRSVTTENTTSRIFIALRAVVGSVLTMSLLRRLDHTGVTYSANASAEKTNRHSSFMKKLTIRILLFKVLGVKLLITRCKKVYGLVLQPQRAARQE
jgi:hypothetical protein